MSVERLVLGLETSCDETAAAVVDAQGEILSSVVSSQVSIHHEFGGVVPELASRHHLLAIVPVTRQALRETSNGLDSLAAVAVTAGPGLVGALLVGLQFAKAISFRLGCPLVAVDHLAAHLEAPYLREGGLGDRPGPVLPHLALLVSGGHTVLLIRRSLHRFEVLGATRDDAAGEAFDKVAKMLGLGYPGGERIDHLAGKGDSTAVRFPRAMQGKRSWDFSFSGLKTAVKKHLSRVGPPSDESELANLCASFQEAVVDVLLGRVCRAVAETGLRRVVVAGGVAANSRLREALARAADRESFELWIPPLGLCTDNAAMVAMAGQRLLDRGQIVDLDHNARAAWARFA